jgi:hypothetical protein
MTTVRRAGAVIAVVAAALLGVVPAQAAERPLLPDLRTLSIPGNQLDVESSSGPTLLHLPNEVADRGAGPLELRPRREHGEDCNHNGDAGDDRHVSQIVYLDKDADGVYERNVDTDIRRVPAGCRYYHPEHGHYHFDDFARYELRDPDTDAVVASATKISFCLLDGYHVAPGLPGSPKSSHYDYSGCSAIDGITGISVGWADLYSPFLFGQWIDVTGVGAGHYCLVAKTDPDNKLRERSDANNAHRTLIDLDPAAETVSKLGSC